MTTLSSNGSALIPTNGLWTPDPDFDGIRDQSKLDRKPIKLMLSLIDRCNLRCTHCLGASNASKPSAPSAPAKPASRELLEFIIQEVLPTVRAVRLGGLGANEQLLAPSFDEFTERAAKHSLQEFVLTTNLSVLNPTRAELIARSYSEIEISMEGVGKNFEAVRGMRWERLVKNLEILKEAKRQVPSNRLKTTFLVCLMPQNFDDLLQLDLFRELGIERMVLRPLMPTAPEHFSQTLGRHPKETARFIDSFRRKAESSGMEHDICFGGSGICSMPFETITIRSDGTTGVCCRLSSLLGPRPVGELKIMEIWNSPAFVDLRKTVNSSKPWLECKGCPVKAPEKAFYASTWIPTPVYRAYHWIKPHLPMPLVQKINQVHRQVSQGGFLSWKSE